MKTVYFYGQLQKQKTHGDKEMWKVEHKPNNGTQPWSAIKSYDNKTAAMLYAASLSGQFYLIKVVDPDGSVVWCN